MIAPICGGRYGGSFKTREEGLPLRMVCDNVQDMTKVAAIPKRTRPVT